MIQMFVNISVCSFKLKSNKKLNNKLKRKQLLAKSALTIVIPQWIKFSQISQST